MLCLLLKTYLYAQEHSVLIETIEMYQACNHVIFRYTFTEKLVRVKTLSRGQLQSKVHLCSEPISHSASTSSQRGNYYI